MKLKACILKCSMAAILLAVPSALSASAIGTLDIAGLGNVFVNATTIDFSPVGPGGNFFVTGALGDFAVIAPGTQGSIADLNIVAAPPGAPLAVPIDPFILVPDPGTLFSYNLEQIFLGSAPSCGVLPGVGGSCTPSNLVPNSPFILTQNAGTVGVQFSGRGTVTNLLDTTQAPYNGLFTANLTVLQYDTIGEVLAVIAGGGSVNSSWSAGFTSTAAPIPEPATFALIGAGLLALVGVGKRFRAR